MTFGLSARCDILIIALSSITRPSHHLVGQSLYQQQTQQQGTLLLAYLHGWMAAYPIILSESVRISPILLATVE